MPIYKVHGIVEHVVPMEDIEATTPEEAAKKFWDLYDDGYLEATDWAETLVVKVTKEDGTDLVINY